MLELLSIVISRKEVEAQNISTALNTLKTLIETPQKAKSYKEQVEISFHGYDDDSRELFEIPEVRNFVYQLDEQFPFWLFFLTKFGAGLQCIYLCFMPPFLTNEAKAEIYPQRLGELLINRWFPAMNQICDYAGLSEGELEALSNRGISYFTEGVFKV